VVQDLVTACNSGLERRDAALKALQDAFCTVLNQQQAAAIGSFQHQLQDQRQQYLVTMQYNYQRFVEYLTAQHGVIGNISSHQAVLDRMQAVLLQLLTKQPMLTDESQSLGHSTPRLVAAAAPPTFTANLRAQEDPAIAFRTLLASSPSFGVTGTSQPPPSVAALEEQGPRGVGARRQILGATGGFSATNSSVAAGGPEFGVTLPHSAEVHQSVDQHELAQFRAWRAAQLKAAEQAGK
jgi:hypothetical protein